MVKANVILEDGRIIKLNLDSDCAPISVANFVELAKSEFYNGLIFHRVIPNFMVQGGGMDINMKEKRTAKTIKGEFLANGVANKRTHKAGTISMARTMVNDSASSQFFICSVNTPHLDGQYAAFGEVADDNSMNIVKDISLVMTKSHGYHDDVPITPIVIKTIEIIED